MPASLSNNQRPDLWSYACQIYPNFKQALLAFQARGLSVNDLLALSYARRYTLSLNERQWEALATGQSRQLLERVRGLRFSLARESPLRATALGWELELERLDLQLLEHCLCPGMSNQLQKPPQLYQLNSDERHDLEALLQAMSTG